MEPLDLVELKIQPGVNETTLKRTLSGEFTNTEIFLSGNYTQGTEETRYETFLEQGQLVVKPKRSRRKIYDVLTWLEGYNEYERVMAEYHGLSVYSVMCTYKNIVIDWSRKYSWQYIQSFDVANRSKKSGISIDFSDYDLVLFTSTFHAGTVKSSVTNTGNTGGVHCYKCGRPDHIRSNCPFRDGPGNQGASTRPSGRSQTEKQEVCYNFNRLKCSYKWCSRAHVCTGCGANQTPHEECRKYGKCAGGQGKKCAGPHMESVEHLIIGN